MILTLLWFVMLLWFVFVLSGFIRDSSCEISGCGAADTDGHTILFYIQI